ncbi:MAG: alpha/beta fold hydrolase [Clostridia bacterium]|nr:alpha/beta fold hydrolase [Clostridia bacterium]
MKKLCAVILTLALAFGGVLSVAAYAAEYSADCPYIFVHGFMGSDIYVDPSDPDSELAWPPSGDRIKEAVKESLPVIGKFLFTHNWQKFADELIPVVTDMFSPIFLSENGELDNTSGVRWEYPAPEDIKKNSELSFVYDWRLNPIDTAADLNDFINYVLECSGCRQVVLECHSYGGVVCTTYARLYGTSKVRSWAFNSTAVFGETYNGELMTGQMRFDPEALTEYLKAAFDYNDKEKLLNTLMQVLLKTGITGAACDLVNYMIDNIGMNKLATGILPLFGRWYSIWAMIPDDKIDEAYNYVFNEVYKDDGVDRSNLRAGIDDYNTRIRPYKAETIEQINSTSNFYVIARYGYCSLFLTPSWKNAGDNTIDLKYASMGATAAQYGETLSDEYIAGVSPEFISPDKTVDASTCAYPEQTWFVRNYLHANLGSSLDHFIKVLLYYDGQATVDTFEEYPRFLYYDESTGEIVPDINQHE